MTIDSLDISPRTKPSPLDGSLVDFNALNGASLWERHRTYHEWVESRHEFGSWPYGRVLASRAADEVEILDKEGKNIRVGCINFGSQDYLGLAQDPRIDEAAIEGIRRFGVHSAGSPALCGRTEMLIDLESALAETLHKETCTVLPTGWAAGFGVMSCLIRPDDAIVIDRLSHNCLREGARHATNNVYSFAHNDCEDLQKKLTLARTKHTGTAIFVVIESLYSMDADSPDLSSIMNLCEEFDAICIIDVAHDFGAQGLCGLGLLETLPASRWPQIIMGSFSKTFASNGGFIAGPAYLRDYLLMYAPSQTFSNAISPIQTSVIAKAFEIAFSEEGARLRADLTDRVMLLRHEMTKRNMIVKGMPCPIVPVFVGDDRLARLTFRALHKRKLLANLVEYPGVAKGDARFRFQVMANHGEGAIIRAAEIMREAKEEAKGEFTQ